MPSPKAVPGTASETINIYLYNTAFAYYDIGYGSAMAVVFFILIVLLSLRPALMLRQRANWSDAGGTLMKRKTLDRIGLLFVALVMISPVVLFFLWMISLSLKYEIDNGAYPPIFIPDRFAWSNYLKVFQENNFFLYLWNSVLVTGAATLLALLIGVPAGMASRG